MTGLTRTERTYDGHYIDAPCDGTLIEMTPLWLDALTLQVALSECGGWHSGYKLVTYARLANVKKSVPELDGARRWCDPPPRERFIAEFGGRGCVTAGS